MPVEAIASLRTQFDKVFQRALRSQEKKQKTRVKLDDALLQCFATLSPKCRDEELEDLIYFILDLYQFHGVAVAIAEVDVDQVVVDLRTALEEHAARTKGKLDEEVDSHLFLVLDKNVQGIPWESIPILRGRSVSRIPSIEFLVDRMQFAAWRGGATEAGNDGDRVVLDRAVVDPRKTFYVLNPSGDLGKTEGRFAAWLKEMHKVGWQGVIGRPPSELQLLNALGRDDLVM
jgi:separase